MPVAHADGDDGAWLGFDFGLCCGRGCDHGFGFSIVSGAGIAEGILERRMVYVHCRKPAPSRSVAVEVESSLAAVVVAVDGIADVVVLVEGVAIEGSRSVDTCFVASMRSCLGGSEGHSWE